MNSLDRLKNICNYSDKINQVLSQNITIKYLAMLDSDDHQELMLELKRGNRDLAIDIMLGDKEEDEWEKRNLSGFAAETTMSSASPNTIGIQVFSCSLQAKAFISYDDIYNEVINLIEANTQMPVKVSNYSRSLDLILVNDVNLTVSENFNANIRRIISRVIACSNVIAIHGRIGPGKTVIVGRNNWDYFKEIQIAYNSVARMQIIYDDNISPDKVIVCRNNTIDQGGILLVDNSSKYYYLQSTLEWKKYFSWFDIK